MMNIQLDMLSPLYYSTLGYDEELINYLAFIDDSFIYELFPEYSNDNKGRTPNDPVVLFRMHFLYYTRPEFKHIIWYYVKLYIKKKARMPPKTDPSSSV